MAEMKTKQTAASVDAFLRGVDASRQQDCRDLIAMMRALTGDEPRMWGPSIVGFGAYHYVYESGREGDWFLCGFSPRKQALTIYVMAGFEGQPELMARLGKYSTGKSCLYVKSLADVDRQALRDLVAASVRALRSGRLMAQHREAGAQRRRGAAKRGRKSGERAAKQAPRRKAAKTAKAARPKGSTPRRRPSS